MQQLGTAAANQLRTLWFTEEAGEYGVVLGTIQCLVRQIQMYATNMTIS
jgi:hypothetical protein